MGICEQINHPESVELMDITRIVYKNKTEEFIGSEQKPLTLAAITPSEITGTILVFTENPLEGKVYRYGNHGKFWEFIGTTCGYA